MTKDWIIRVYNNADREIASWIIKGKLDNEAYSDARGEIERNWFNRFWTITPL